MDKKDIIVIVSLADRALISMNALTPNDVELIKKIMNNTDDKTRVIIRSAFPSVFEHID